MAAELVRRGAVPAGMWAFEALRIAARVPRFGLDTDHRTIPHEVGWIETAVHLSKGCYRGQETVARVHNLGHPPRRLVFLDLDGSVDRLPAHGYPVELDGATVGFTGSAARHYELGPIGLALVKRTVPVDATLLADGVAAAQEVIVPPDAGREREGNIAPPPGNLIFFSRTGGYLAVLRRVLLAASASSRLRQLITTAPRTRAIVDSYVAGETEEDAVRVTRALRAAGLLVSLDYLGEDTKDPAQAAAVTDEYIELLGKLAAEGLTQRGAAEVSVKPTAVGCSSATRTATENISRICDAAREAGTTVTLDAEEFAAIEPTLRIAAQLRAQHSDLGCVVQACLRRSEADCRALAGYGIRVRLCKGAYREPESVAFTARRDVDASYARCLRTLMNGPGYPMLATHDPRLIEIAGSLALLTGRAAGQLRVPDALRHPPGRAAAAGRYRRAGCGCTSPTAVTGTPTWCAGSPNGRRNLAFFLRSLRSYGACQVIAILGTGKMGEALLSGLLRAGRPPSAVVAAVRREDRGAELHARYGVQVDGRRVGREAGGHPGAGGQAAGHGQAAG